MIDPKIQNIIEREDTHLREYINLIASENFPSADVLACLGSVLSQRYTEGYPGHRHYAGCEIIDELELYAIDLACKLFGCAYANVQPWSGSQANAAAFNAFLKPGDRVMSMSLADGAHLTHGSKFTFSGKYFEHSEYGLDDTGRIDYDNFRDVLNSDKPRLVVAGASAYPREIDFKKMRGIIDEYRAATGAECFFMVDMAHIAGLVAGGVHMSPIPYADVVTSTTHKTLSGPRGGLILWNDDAFTKKINQSVFPGIQGGPNQASIAAKAQCFNEAMRPEFKKYAAQIVKNIQGLIDGLKSEIRNQKSEIKIVTGGSDNHMVLLDVSHIERKISAHEVRRMTGQAAEDLLYANKIICNKNMIRGDLKPGDARGIRLGMAAMTTRGYDYDMSVALGTRIGNILTGN